MLNYQSWLERTDVVRILLIEVNPVINGTPTTIYLSTHPATVGSISYQAIVKNSVSINESLSLDYTANINFGDIEIVNTDGIHDSWLSYIWKNRSVKIYYGSLPLPGQNLL